MAELKHLINPQILNSQAYKTPTTKVAIKLDAMENPYCLPEQYQTKWLQHLQQCELNRYPDSNASSITDGLRELMLVPKSSSIMLGNGSDELIQIILMALTTNAVIMAPAPSFVMYQLIAKLTKVKFIAVPLTADFELYEIVFLAAIKQHKPSVIFIANPNNPTGNLFSRATITNIIKASDGLVVLDEAYHSFASDSFMADLTNYDNLLVMRTVSKMGLAGVRLGLLAGAEKWLTEFNKVRLPYNINSLTQKTIEFILQNRDFLEPQIQKIKQNRSKLADELTTIDGIKVFSSDANFILFKVDNADEIHQRLKDKSILIKNLHGSHPMLDNCLRVTIGTNEENQKFMLAIVEGIGWIK